MDQGSLASGTVAVKRNSVWDQFPVSLLSSAFNKIDDVKYKVTVLKGVSSAWRQAVSSRSAWEYLTACNLNNDGNFCDTSPGFKSEPSRRHLHANLKDLKSKKMQFEPIGFVLSRCRHLRKLNLSNADSMHALLCNYSLPELTSISYNNLDHRVGVHSDVISLIDQCKQNLKTMILYVIMDQTLATAVLGCAHVETLCLRLSISECGIFEAFCSPSLKRLSLMIHDLTFSVSSLSKLCAQLQNGVLRYLSELKVSCESGDEIRQVLVKLLNQNVMQSVKSFKLLLMDDSLEENIDTTMISNWVAALPKLAPEIVDFELNVYSAIRRKDECFTAIEVRRVIQSWLSTVGDQKRQIDSGTELVLRLDVKHKVMQDVISNLDSDLITISDVSHSVGIGVGAFTVSDLNSTVKLTVHSLYSWNLI